MADKNQQIEFTQIIPLAPAPGINRDNTKFSKDVCVDGQHCRWYYGRPKKIGGYNALNVYFPDIQYGSHVISANGINYYFSGSANNLYVTQLNNVAAAGGLSTRTPVDFVPNTNTVWQFADMFDTGSSAKVVFAHPGQNLSAIDSTVNTTVYYGNATASGVALADTTQSVSGGVCVLHPYPFVYGNDGFVTWPAPGTVNFSGAGSGSARITGSKIIKGRSTRGGAGFSPSGLFWSLDSLQRLYFVGGTSIFANDFVTKTYPLSSSAIVEVNGLFYWPCADRRFSMWNGSVQDVPNNYNQLYFFNNLNYAWRQKVWGVRVSAYNEIWWFYPFGASTECNAVIIYNYKDNIWYDTTLSRSTGVEAAVLPYPIMFDNQLDTIKNFYRLWQHEIGVDKVVNGMNVAIQSYFESNIMTLVDKSPNSDKWTRLEWFEQDFIQSGNLTMNVTGESYSEDAVSIKSEDFTLLAQPTDKTYTKEQRRFLRVRVESNVAGGNFYMGKPLLKIYAGNGRQFTS